MKKKLIILTVFALGGIGSALQAKKLSPMDLATKAMEAKYAEVTQSLQEGSDPNKVPVPGFSPVLFILTVTFFTKGGNYNDFKTAMQTALAKGAKLNVKSDKNKNTPLHQIVIKGTEALKKNYLTEAQLFEIIKLLVSKGADINIKNKAGKSPLGLATPSDLVSPVIKRQLLDAAGMTG